MFRDIWRIGDEFEILKDADGNIKKGEHGKVVDIDYFNCYPLKLKFEDGNTINWRDDDDIIKLKKGTTMQKLNSMLKLLLGADEQTLYKAGFINGDLNLTSEGMEALKTILFAANKAALVTLATEKLAEEKAE